MESIKTINSKEELKKALDNGEKVFIVSNKKLLKALAVRYWVQENKVKGALLMAALPAAIAIGAVSAPLIGIVGAGLVVGGATIGTTEILVIGGDRYCFSRIIKRARNRINRYTNWQSNI